MPREGIYAGINACLRDAAGEFVYIATADDTMSPDCLTKMVAALDSHPECGICHCSLQVIDEQGQYLPEWHQWTNYYASHYFKDWMKVAHIRYAPHDGILHFALATVYTSLTQLLVRRVVFDRVGMFDSGFGSMGDFEWGMRVSLIENTVHVPEFLATWRKHVSQATKEHSESAANRILLQRMARVAFHRAQLISPALLKDVSLSICEYAYDYEHLWLTLKEAETRLSRLGRLLEAGLRNPKTVAAYLSKRLKVNRDTTFNRNQWCADTLSRFRVAPPQLCKNDAESRGI